MPLFTQFPSHPDTLQGKLEDETDGKTGLYPRAGARLPETNGKATGHPAFKISSSWK